MVKQLKEDKANELDVKVAVNELKKRKKIKKEQRTGIHSQAIIL